jgi:transcriptional regulator with XRE-family HTH domain
MAGNRDGNPVTHFGRQVRKERLTRGWSLQELARRTGIAAPHLSRIENGRRPPTENVAIAMDAAFPERDGWFLEFYDESRSWAPAGFRDWPEHEDRAARLHVWSPSILHGLLQAEDYARALLVTLPGASGEVVEGRLKSRMERQRRVLLRDDPPEAWFIVDEHSLYRHVGSPQVMAGQMHHLAEVSRLPGVTVQVLPAVAHPATQSGLLIADGAAYAEHVAGGFVYTDEETVSSLLRLFDTLRGESYRVSESLRTIERLGEIWTGGSPPTAGPTAETAWKPQPPATA